MRNLRGSCGNGRASALRKKCMHETRPACPCLNDTTDMMLA